MRCGVDKFKKDTTYKNIRAAQAKDIQAKEKLVEDNMGLVISIAKRFYNRGYDPCDINQLGVIGLLRAIDNFNPDLGLMFSTYAVPMILGEIKRFLRDDGPLKVSRSIKQTAAQITAFVEKETKEKGVSPGVVEIAENLGISPEDVVAAMDATAPPESINSTIGNSNTELSDLLRANIDEGQIITKIDVKSAIEKLDSRERIIVTMRFFMDKTQTDIAKKLGISQVQVSRLEKKILEKLKRLLMCEN
ncbi:MAG: sigma-70 family RNA polymerase sigma factor [Clostridia bacterium]|nr:sigma-70 family RNA polymerase sigma factor [Clostridia bacterium]